MMRGLLMSIACFGSLAGTAQLDTIRMVSVGGPAEEGAIAAIALGEEALILGYTDSNDWGERAPWLLRLDTNLQVVWHQTLELDHGGVAVGGVLLEDGNVAVVSRELLYGASGYGIRWHRVDATTGAVLSTSSISGEDWLLPVGLSLKGDTLVTWATDYATGTAQPTAFLSTWSVVGHEVWDTLRWGMEGVTESLSAADIGHNRLWMACTERPAMDSARVRLRVSDFAGEELWSLDLEVEGALVEANSIDVADSMLLIGATLADGTSMPQVVMAIMDTSAVTDPLLLTLANSAQSRDLRWHALEIEGLFRSELFGFGQGDMLFQRRLPSGQFIEAWTFGWEDAEEPSQILYTAQGAIWLIGSTDHGNPNVHAVRAPSSPITGHVLEDFVIDLAAPLEVPTLQRSSIRAIPNPAHHVVHFEGLPCADAAFVAFTVQGNIMERGIGNSLDVTAWPQGVYFVDVWCGLSRYSLRLVRE